MPSYIGVGSVARKIKNQYIGVGGVARKIKAGYVGVGGVARKFFTSGYDIVRYIDSGLEIPTINPSGNSLTMYALGPSRNCSLGMGYGFVVNNELDGLVVTFDCDQEGYDSSMATMDFCGRLKTDPDETFRQRRVLLTRDGSYQYTIPPNSHSIVFSIWINSERYADIRITNFKINGKNFNLETGEFY